MLGLKTKINLTTVAILVLVSLSIVVVSWKSASDELSSAVETGTLDLAHAVASDISIVNTSEFKMLESLANLSTIRDPKVDMHDKWELVNSAVKGNSRYYGLGFFNSDGIGYATTGKWSDLHTRKYLSVSMRGNNALQDPDWSAVNGHLCSYYAVPVHDPQGMQIAEISAVVDATELCDTMLNINVGTNSHPFVMNRVTGNYVAHQDPELIKTTTAVVEKTSVSFRPVLDRICAGETATEVYVDSDDNRKYVVAYQPIDNTDWSVVLVAPYKDFYSGINKLLGVMIAISIFALVVAIIVMIIIINGSVKPLRTVSGAVEGIATGNADLTRRLADVPSKDEVGGLVKNFNLFLSKMQTIIHEVSVSKVDLSEYGDRLGKNVTDNNKLLAHILGSIRDVDIEIDNQHEKVGSTVQAVESISSSVDELRSLLDKQTEGVNQASSAVTQMIGNINSVSSSVDKMASEFDVLEKEVGTGILKQREVNEQIQMIEQQSKMLREANTVISSIAEQTNLLAMNAAIEAAHAGEAGKGFSVVADEIRKLSENSSAQSKNIGTQLQAILGSIDTVVRSSDESDKSFSSVADKIRVTGNLVREIDVAMSEQSAGSKQISDTLGYMNDATTHVLAASDSVDNARKEITEDVNVLKQSSDAVRGLISNMEGSVKRIEEDDNALLKLATSISESIYRIGSQIDQFTV